jgi:hypothetical protein
MAGSWFCPIAYVTGAAFTVDGGLALMNRFEPLELGEV